MKFRKKPVIIEAMLWTGKEDCVSGMREFIGPKFGYAPSTMQLEIDTLEGRMIGSPGDFIIKGIAGEIYPCKPNIFAATYEPVKSPEDKP